MLLGTHEVKNKKKNVLTALNTEKEIYIFKNC